jgi:PAS domain S-box-containing protein
MKLSTRMALAMVVLVALTALAVGVLTYRNVRAIALPRAAERMEVHVRLLAATLEAAVRGARQDITGFQSAAAIAGIARAHGAGGVDPEGGTTEAVWRGRIANRFVAELAAKTTYDQFRIITADGRELVRVDRSGPNGATRIVREDELRQKFDRPYVAAALATSSDQIYVSPLEFNQEHRAIQAPHIPVLRVARRLDAPDGKPFGIVIINVDMRSAFRELATSPQPHSRIYVVDDRGNYLVHPDPSQEFAVDLGRLQRWQSDFPALAATFPSDEAKTALITDSRGERTLAGLQSVILAGGPRVAVLETTPEAAVTAPVAEIGESTLLVGAISVLCATALAVLFARSLTRPLVQMTKAVESFARGQAAALPDAGGEIGVLAQAFARATSDVRTTTASLTQEVEEHRRTAAELERQAERERLFSAAVRSSVDAIIITTPDGIVTGWNPAAVRLFGWSGDEVLGRSVDIIVPDNRRAEVRSILKRVRGGELIHHHETVRLDRAGCPIEVSLSVSPIRLSSGQVIGACKIVRDITEQKKVRKALEEEIAERSRIAGILDNTINSMGDAVLVADQDARIVLSNPAAERLMGIRAGMSLSEWSKDQYIFMSDGVTPLPRDQRPLVRALNGDTFENYEIVVRPAHAEKPFTLVTTGAPIRRNGKNTGAVVVYRDLTEAQETEQQLHQSQKMEAVGQLTGGIAHDFNNILTVITGTMEILKEGVADRPDMAAVARMIEEAAERGAELTRHLLAFSRRQPLAPRQTNVNELVVEAGRLLRPTLGENIEIESMLDDDVSLALIDANQLTTAILNLAINARDAMPNGGKLTIETADVVLDESYAGMNADVRPGTYVMVAVSDNGCGIPPGIIDKVLDPFFTTKTVGKGTGLGLSMVYGFVKQSGGHVKIYSEEGHGTTIRMYLPRASTEMQQGLDGTPLALIDGGGHETVLIVEDDALVRNYVVAQVRALGYRTLAATNAGEALALIDSEADIDLLFTDIVMPGAMNGKQLADEALKRRPGLRVLFTSGYAENAIMHYGRLDPGVLLLPKPYRKAQLAQMVRTALGGAAAVKG